MRGGNRLSLVVLLNNRTTVGGGELAVYRYAASLARRGHRVTVFANWRNDFMRKARPAGMRVRFRRGLPPSIRASGRFNRWWARMYGRLFIEPCLLGEKPDFICGYLRQAAADAWRYGRKYGIRVVNFVFETPDLVMRELGDILPPAEAARLRRQWDAVRQAYREAAVLVPLSETVRQECARWTGRPVAPPVYLGVDADEAIKHPASDEHIVYVGRLDVYKNVQDLIRATARLPDPPPLVIAGSGYEERDLRRLAVQLGVECRFTGMVTEDEKWRFLRRAYFLVFPSTLEGFGIPPAECLAAEKPAVCSDIPVLREVYGEAVEFFPLHDVEALTRVMARLLGDPAYRRRRGRLGREFVCARYSWERAGEALERILLEGPAGGDRDDKAFGLGALAEGEGSSGR